VAVIGLMVGPLGAPRPAAAQGSDILGGLIGEVTRLTSDYELDISRLVEPTPEDWQAFWRLVQQVLQSDSLEQMAELQPYAAMAVAYLDQYEEARPYADWLRQRLDYFSVADEVMRESAPPDRAPPPPPVRPTTISPPPRRTPPAPLPAPARPSAKNKAGELDRWIKRLEGRPPPKNAATYVPLLKPVFVQEGVPGELVWLAEVESSFDPKARSPVGALGLYQFMPATAERFGLKLTPRDERVEPERSAVAAAKYLRFLHGRFGSWPLALAAYNAGEGRVGRLLKQQGVDSFDGIAGVLPTETRMYVPKVGAVVQIREGVTLEQLTTR
jgi:membrane-bound lytic murein transglycosylase D